MIVYFIGFDLDSIIVMLLLHNAYQFLTDFTNTSTQLMREVGISSAFSIYWTHEMHDRLLSRPLRSCKLIIATELNGLIIIPARTLAASAIIRISQYLSCVWKRRLIPSDRSDRRKMALVNDHNVGGVRSNCTTAFENASV